MRALKKSYQRKTVTIPNDDQKIKTRMQWYLKRGWEFVGARAFGGASLTYDKVHLIFRREIQ